MEPSRQVLSQALKEEARRLGFTLVGITQPDPPASYPAFERWLAQGYHGEMSYLTSERNRLRRADPRLVLPECQSIVVLGMPYDSRAGKHERVDSTGSFFGKVASYAWGVDYHELLPDKLQVLVAFIEAKLGRAVPNRWYTDTGPLLERELGWRAGLGWIGKNSCLINPRQGSYFFLAEILLGIELEPDAPFPADHCGSCTRCITACPTNCILPDRTLDARRCISYLTIELKSAIPLDLRTTIGEWVFGCDICQQVCPWNQRFAPTQGDPGFASLSGVPEPDLTKELTISAEVFQQKFNRSPVRRPRRRGYLRNVAVALGNLGKMAGAADRADAVQALGTGLEDPEAVVREHAAWALGEVGGNSAKRLLEQAALRESDSSVLAEIQQALQKIRPGEAPDLL